jgi:hypothetical protein
MHKTEAQQASYEDHKTQQFRTQICNKQYNSYKFNALNLFHPMKQNESFLSYLFAYSY